jgi:hypothetical protein
VIHDVDVGSLMPPGLVLQLDESILHDILRMLADTARAKWVSLAKEKLHRTANDYTRAIQPVEFGDFAASITLMGAWPNQIERGYGPYDMRKTLLGPNVPVVERGAGKGKHARKDGGFYRSIFFRLGAPTSSGRNFQRVTDAYAKQLGADRANALGRQAWKEMRKLDPSLSNPGEKTKWGARLNTAGTGMDVKGRSHKLVTMPDGSTALIRHGGAEHHSPLFEGAVKMQQTYKRATQAFYGTFRTISTGQPNGWIHPGYAGAHLAPEVVRFIEHEGPGMVQAILDRVVKPPGGA